MMKSTITVIASCLLFMFTLIDVVAQKPTKPTYRKATIGSVAIVPPSGKKPGSIGSIEITTLLHQSSSSVIGLTGRSNGSQLEFVVYEEGMQVVLNAWIDGWKAKSAAKQQWDVVGSSHNACIITTQLYAGLMEEYEEPVEYYENTYAYLVGMGSTAVSIPWGSADVFRRLDVNCGSRKLSGDDYYAKVLRGGPYYTKEMSSADNDYGTNMIVALGTGNVLELDNTYTQISIKDCHILGMICYQIDEYTKEKNPTYFGQQCEEGNIQEHYLINPETGKSTKLR